MSEQTRIKPLEQAYYEEWGTERTDKDRPNYKHWLEQRVTQLEAKNERLRERAKAVIHNLTVGEPFLSDAGGDAAYLLTVVELRDALKESE